jgi:hypothetical protein
MAQAAARALGVGESDCAASMVTLC